MTLNNINFSIELTKYEGAKIINDPNGNPGVFIPIAKNDLFVKDSRVYASFSAWGNRDGNPDGYGKTHAIKPRFGKEFNESNKSVVDRIGYIGNGKLIAPKQATPPQPQQWPANNEPAF